MADQALFPTADVELTEVMEEVRTVVERVRPTRVVFDAIAELRLLANDSTRFQHQLFALWELFATTGATVVFLDTPPQAPGTRELASAGSWRICWAGSCLSRASWESGAPSHSCSPPTRPRRPAR